VIIIFNVSADLSQCSHSACGFSYTLHVFKSYYWTLSARKDSGINMVSNQTLANSTSTMGTTDIIGTCSNTNPHWHYFFLSSLISFLTALTLVICGRWAGELISGQTNSGRILVSLMSHGVSDTL